MPHAVLRRPLTAETRVHFQASLCGDMWLTVGITPPVLHTHLFISDRRYTILATESVVK
jgi:hypothetical protein